MCFVEKNLKSGSLCPEKEDLSGGNLVKSHDPLKVLGRAAIRSSIVSDEISLLSKKFGNSPLELHALNIERLGVKTDFPEDIVKIRIGLKDQENILFKPIINAPESPYTLKTSEITLDDEKIIDVYSAKNDSPDPYYFRGEDTLVINSTFLSPCNQSCKFCEQTNLPKEKQRYSIKIGKQDIFKLVMDEKNIDDLSSLKQISIVTSCTGTEKRALELADGYLSEARKVGFNGRLLFATNEIRTEEGLKKLAEFGDVILAFTVECFENRSRFMPGAKGAITLDEIKSVLGKAMKYGIDTTFFYVLGLDELDEMKKGFENMKDSISIAPSASVFYPLAGSDIEQRDLKYYLDARSIYEEVFKGKIMLSSKQVYRSLWPLNNDEDHTILWN